MNKNAYAKIAPFTITVMILATAISGMFITVTDTVKAEGAGTIYTIWLPSDMQISSDGADYNYTLWNDSVCDANNVTVNISFVVGDQIQGYSNAGGTWEGNWNEAIWEWDRFFEYFDTLNTDIYKNVTIGNHDIFPATGGYPYPNHMHSWRNHSRLNNITNPYGNYTWEWGNILFIILATEGEIQPGGADGANIVGKYENQTEWFQSVVENNTDKNILVICHYPLQDTVFASNVHIMKIADSNSFKTTLASNDHVRGWFNGHVHDNGGHVATYENCTCVDCDSTNTQNGRTSVFLYIQENNATVDVKSYNHVNDAFEPFVNLPTNFTLKYNFTLSGPANTTPTLSTPNPSNETTAVSLSQSTWNISINDTEGDTFNWTIQTYPDIGSGGANTESNGTKEVSISNLLTNTTYTIYVNATDGVSGNWTNETFWFTTESIPTINSINGPNNAVSIDSYRNLRWYKVNNTQYYQLQISNTSDFSDLLYNVSNINSTNYGAEYYHEVGNSVYFNITNIFHNEIYVANLVHYYRIRALI